ncbi:hypothetical protein CKN73_04465 [Carnobacterium divergens]|uniref:hypothetical protein n=1 Tax=Carnobacterium divergens TaxID=2748 RepID=UPI0010717945|nr:hypothetical protein [Carnobacterium divergens]TFJ42668.1 hypothetical protein CKN77_04390 [Carnobacterium divergens]TFJ51201.1 hypothetical protein CKN73_04465 [Carnobacterium divergens]TFJ56131.1 hypothetical protein CKN83_04405 [Carnobacterium divergens]TFJ62564.1 hypothetical protein CKN89_04490 [Carnobacterium divergens]TFJ72804.1 hypothetical protein CKN91_04410 [Carnobacterium divergens]
MDKNEQERVMYNRLIIEKENSVDDLKNDQRKIEGSLQQLQEDLQRGYRMLGMLNDEKFRENPENLQLQRRDEEQEHLFKSQLREAEEELSESYTKQRKVLDDEAEELYRKRGGIPWD